MLLGDGAGLEGQLNRAQHRLLIVMQHERQDLNHLPVPTGALEQHRLESFEAVWQLDERRAIAKRPWLSLDDRQIVTPIVDGTPRSVMAAGNQSQMLYHTLAFGGDDESLGVHANTHRAIGERGRHTLAVTLEDDEAGRRYAFGVLDKPVKRRRHAHQMRPLISPHLDDCPLRLLGVGKLAPQR